MTMLTNKQLNKNFHKDVKHSQVFLISSHFLNKWERVHFYFKGVLWLSGRALDSESRGFGFDPNWQHCVCVVSLSEAP